MLIFADHAGEDGTAWPSVSRISKYANINRRQVFNQLKELAELGELTHVGFGFRGVKKYKITLSTSALECTGAEDCTSAEDCTPTSAEDCTSTSALECTLTTIEPPLEPPSNDQSAFLEQFEKFYEAFPRKVGKGQARKAFKTALTKVDFETILNGVVKYAKHTKNSEKQFIAHPATWLNGERWSDEYDVQRRASKW